MALEEDDPRPRLAYDRTLLANERTYASWIRTGLSVAGVGLAAAHLVPGAGPRRPLVFVLGSLLVVCGVGIILFGAWRFADVNRDLAGSGSPRTAVEPRAIYLLGGAVALLLLALLFVL